MSKTVRVVDSVYQELLQLQQPRETFSEVVARALHTLRVIQQISDTLGPSHPITGGHSPRAREEETIKR